jgi:hypothetical protein
VYFPIPECDWRCNRIHQKWCDEHSRYIDFQVYISTKETIISHYRQIRMHEDSKAFHPAMVDSINSMIQSSIDLIKTLRKIIDEFHNKYKEDGVHGNKQT